MIPAAVFTTISDQNVGVVNVCVCVSQGGYSLYEACYEPRKWLDGWLGAD